jgi:hypothetical protein
VQGRVGEQPTKFDLVANMIAAKAFGVKIPETFPMRAATR